VSLRTKISFVLFGLLVLSVGTTGMILIGDSSGFIGVELDDKHRLLAENRAFALRRNLLILEEELASLARLPELSLIDSHPAHAAQLLAGAVQNPDLYNTAVLLISRDGTCLWSVPARDDCRGRSYAESAWFAAARDGAREQRHLVETDAPVAGPRHKINIIQPIWHGGTFLGALVGVVAMGEDHLVTPALRDNLPAGTEAILVDRRRRVLYPPQRSGLDPGWEEAAAAAAEGRSGTLHRWVRGQESLLAYAPVGADTPYAVIFRWPWRDLTQGLRRQVQQLALILCVGTVLAGLMGLWLSSYLTRPLRTLGAIARHLAAGEYGSLKALRQEERADEIGDLLRAFRHMGDAIQQRDQELLQAAAQLEARVQQRTRELAQAQEALLAAERFSAMGKAAAAIAHELKNSMGGLGMAVELILQDPTRTARVDRLRQQVLDEIERLRGMTEALLSFARDPRPQRAPQDLLAIVRHAVELAGDVAVDRGVQVEIAAAGPQPLSCDGAKIQSAITNLVRNAVEAGRRVRVRLAGGAGEARVEVEDDGPGLSQEARAHLFEPFFTTKANGTGLGLPTAKRFIEAHGGRIEAGRSADLGGARFALVLPEAAP
jgi:signal transduction histidine kinase